MPPEPDPDEPAEAEREATDEAEAGAESSVDCGTVANDEPESSSATGTKRPSPVLLDALEDDEDVDHVRHNLLN